MALSFASHWMCTVLVCLAVGYSTAAAVNVTASDRIPTPGARRDNRLQFINAEVEVCEGENASFILHMAIPANLTADQVYERTVWSPDKINFCHISGNTSACYGKDFFVQRATISDTWFPVQPGERTKHGQLKFQLNNVSLADAGRYGPELKTDFYLNSVNVILTVKDASACQQKPQDGDTGEKTDPETYWRRGFEGGFGAGFGACLGLVIMGGLAAAIWRYRTKDENQRNEAVTIIQVRVGKDKAVPPGGSAVLPCNYSVPSDDVQPLVSWWKDRGPVLTRRIVYEYRAGRLSKGYGGWAGRTALVGQASLEILNITTDDEGKYECEVRVPLVYGAARGYILLSVLNGEHGEQNRVPHSPLGRTAMIVVGVLVSCLLLTAASSAMDGGLIRLKPQHNVTAKEGQNANLTWKFGVPAEIDVTNMNDMTVWAEDRTSYCELMSENGIYRKFCYGDFVGRAEVAVTWFPKREDGNRTRKGQLKLVLTNVTRDDTGWYEGEIKLHGRDIRNGKIFLHVTENCLVPSTGVSTVSPVSTGCRCDGISTGLGAGFGLGLLSGAGLVILTTKLKAMYNAYQNTTGIS
ncbi:PREDICTED: uncharacterized protein LOC109474792 [Branchiostoma belcheri]|uniref:Uncharacterized protein LOC109474792 n=1 Tax=Branchiostoma belcheri TaxID=7741 RepID=A0A6P4ZM76_BRABE|nr:PREDICTED: uncharacterized protein LOC109474792 [Branchiostoma belcheri]